MPRISGSLHKVTTDLADVTEVWVHAVDTRTHGEDVILTNRKVIKLVDGVVEFDAYPGAAVLIPWYADGTHNDPIRILVGEADTQDLVDVVVSADIFDDVTDSAGERLVAEVIANAKVARQQVTQAQKFAGDAADSADKATAASAEATEASVEAKGYAEDAEKSAQSVSDVVDAEINPAVTKAKESADLAVSSAEAAAGSASDAAESAKQAKEAAESGGGGVADSDAVSDFSDGKQAGKLIKVGEDGNIKVPRITKADAVGTEPVNVDSMADWFPYSNEAEVSHIIPAGVSSELNVDAAASIGYVNSRISSGGVSGVRYEDDNPSSKYWQHWKKAYDISTGETMDRQSVINNDVGSDKKLQKGVFYISGKVYVDERKFNDSGTGQGLEFTPYLLITYYNYRNNESNLMSVYLDKVIKHEVRPRKGEWYNRRIYSCETTLYLENYLKHSIGMTIWEGSKVNPDKATLDIIHLV